MNYVAGLSLTATDQFYVIRMQKCGCEINKRSSTGLEAYRAKRTSASQFGHKFQHKVYNAMQSQVTKSSEIKVNVNFNY